MVAHNAGCFLRTHPVCPGKGADYIELAFRLIRPSKKPQSPMSKPEPEAFNPRRAGEQPLPNALMQNRSGLPKNFSESGPIHADEG